MGLDIVVYENVKVHSCATRKRIEIPEGEHYKRRMGNDSMWHFVTKDSIEDSHLHTFTPLLEYYDCECEDSENLRRFHMGYSSCLDIEQYPYFGPYEFDKSEGFYFGSYMTYARLMLSDKVPLLRFTSDCDGCYGGEPFLLRLRSQLEAVSETDQKAAEYFDILNGKDLSRCVVQHC
nr:uncharacterized protein LOC122271259 [Parasteatoda tepidariorum]